VSLSAEAMSDPELADRPSGSPQQAAKTAPRRERARLIAAVILAALVTAFAVANLDDVKVNWLIGTGQTPLIVVIAVAIVLGILVDRLIIFRAKRRQRA